MGFLQALLAGVDMRDGSVCEGVSDWGAESTRAGRGRVARYGFYLTTFEPGCPKPSRWLRLLEPGCPKPTSSRRALKSLPHAGSKGSPVALLAAGAPHSSTQAPRCDPARASRAWNISMEYHLLTRAAGPAPPSRTLPSMPRHEKCCSV